ncbi:MAG: GNAT family N-acetyltransferase [Ornithinimicrobium sp.]|uniref:GNAT family N-acetyltransferase n=1 Tax=Ornithinimicrobium sp. TaxID=1977084 RepID=UPI003D9AC159
MDDHTEPPTTPAAAPRLVELSSADAGRIKTFEETVWFEHTPGMSVEQWVEGFDYTAGKGVEVDASPPPGAPAGESRPLVGLYGAFDMQLTVPGPGAGLSRVPLSGLSWVGVHPDHRRRGILRSMMTDHLHGLHDTGRAAVAGLWAAEVGIYGRYGYAASALEVTLELGRGAELTIPPAIREGAAEVSTHLVPAASDEAAAVRHTVHQSATSATLGSVTRTEELGRVYYRDVPKARGTKEPRQMLLAQDAAGPAGYAVLRRTSDWDDRSNPQGKLDVVEVAAADPVVLAALALRLLDMDLIGKVKIRGRSTEDPLVWWAGGPRTAACTVTDGLWLRLVDLPRALAERGYASEVDLVLEVTDDFCPWNAGRWRFAVDAAGIGSCEPSDAEADLVLPVQVLAAAYAGGRSVAAQAAAGAVTEVRPGTAVTLSRAMRGDVEPFGAIGF